MCILQLNESLVLFTLFFLRVSLCIHADFRLEIGTQTLPARVQDYSIHASYIPQHLKIFQLLVQPSSLSFSTCF